MAATSPPPGLTGTIVLAEGDAVLSLVGEIDLATTATLQALLQEAVQTGTPRVVVDVVGVTFCDCQGLGALVAVKAQLKAFRRQLTIRHATGGVRRLFRVAGLSAYLEDDGELPDEALLDQLVLVTQVQELRGLLDSALGVVATMSQAVIAHAHGVSVTLSREGRLQTVAASNDVVLNMDYDQYGTDQGPCLDAATLGEPVDSPSLDTEQRWPLFVPKAQARGIRSIISTPLMAHGQAIGALNVYSREETAFSAREKQWAAQFAEQASTLLTEARSVPTHDALTQGLGEALMAREVIAQAQGIVMDRRRLTPAMALRFLLAVSRSTSRPLLTVCRDTVNTVARRGAHDPR